MKEEEIRKIYLVNALVLFGAPFEYLKKIDAPDFDVEFEMSVEFESGLGIDNIMYLKTHNVIDEQTTIEIFEFRDYLKEIPDAFWTMDELEANSIWKNVRMRVDVILRKLNIDNKVYDFSIINKRFMD